jgi:transcriptional regulator with XRE-family HTH domain
VSIGETLAEARHEAGLTVAQVSERTRIRETIIRNIEHDDFTECGGDFYARGHIRAIAKAVVADPEPLIEEYDAVHRAPGAMATVSLDELLATSEHGPQRHLPDLPAVWARVTAAGAPAAKASLGSLGGRVAAGYQARRHTARWAVFVGLALVVVVLGFVALRLLAGSPPARSSAAGSRAVTHHAAGHRGPGSTAANGHRRAAAPSAAPRTSHSAAPSGPLQSLTPVQATAFGPNGGDNPQLAHLVLGGQHAGGWHTDWYSTPRFGNLYPGTGLLLNMGQTVAITSAQIDLGNTSGASFELRVGTKPSMSDLSPVAHASGAGGVVRLHLDSPARGRYVLIWFTKLPTDPSGTFQARVDSVSLQGNR